MFTFYGRLTIIYGQGKLSLGGVVRLYNMIPVLKSPVAKVPYDPSLLGSTSTSNHPHGDPSRDPLPL